MTNWYSFLGRKETQACAITWHSMVHILKNNKHVIKVQAI